MHIYMYIYVYIHIYIYIYIYVMYMRPTALLGDLINATEALRKRFVHLNHNLGAGDIFMKFHEVVSK